VDVASNPGVIAVEADSGAAGADAASDLSVTAAFWCTTSVLNKDSGIRLAPSQSLNQYCNYARSVILISGATES
jgi:hypothetical protein